MEPLAESEIRAAMVNSTRSQVASMAIPKLGELDWAELDFLGWRDPKAPLRGYVVLAHAARTAGIALRAAEAPMSRRIKAMCMMCRTGRGGGDVTLFVANRAGTAGRNGNTVGTYICADLACSRNVRMPKSLPDLQLDPGRTTEERIDGLRTRLGAFVDEVLKP